jgi:hypothetical protein
MPNRLMGRIRRVVHVALVACTLSLAALALVAWLNRRGSQTVEKVAGPGMPSGVLRGNGKAAPSAPPGPGTRTALLAAWSAVVRCCYPPSGAVMGPLRLSVLASWLRDGPPVADLVRAVRDRGVATSPGDLIRGRLLMCFVHEGMPEPVVRRILRRPGDLNGSLLYFIDIDYCDCVRVTYDPQWKVTAVRFAPSRFAHGEGRR